MRLKNRIAIGAVAALTALTAPTVVASAQQPQDVPLSTVVAVGTSVRVTSTAVGGKLQGIVAAVDEKLLTLSRDGGPPVTMPLTSITALDMHVGRKRNTVKGAWIGALGGALVGLLYPVDSDDPGCGLNSTQGRGQLQGACSRGEALAFFTVGGLADGAIIGALIKSDRWSPVTFDPARATIGPRPSGGLSLAPMAPVGGGIGIRLAVSF